MPHTRSQGPPPVLAFEEPEQEFHTNLRSRLSQVRVLAPILFSPSSSTPSSPSHTPISPFPISPVYFDMAEEMPPPPFTSNFNSNPNPNWNPNSNWRNSNNNWRGNNSYQPRQNQAANENSGAGPSSSGDPEVKDMLKQQMQMLQQLIAKDQHTQVKLQEHDTLLRNQQSAFLDLQRSVGWTTRSGRGGEKEVEKSPDVDEEEPVDEEIELETPDRVHQRLGPASTAPVGESSVEKKGVEAEKKKMEEKRTPEVDISRLPYPARALQQKYAQEYGHF
ncbi:hypothetical protein E3N88_32902 [Mikania micrantha]|uniref:Uncharacterized protein n=1 Tax=Mikania micrantha TaxID=192012 RepID=A0A5N6MAA4_9ASTR|nr:hypothetical protein E3N88_32902 [Mikania micrantha]